MRAVGIIAAAGSSSRMGSGLKKEYRLLPAGAAAAPMTVLSSSIQAFIDAGVFGALAIVHPPGGEAEARQAVDAGLAADYRGKLIFVPGGDCRMESVLYGLHALKAFDPETVLIHDAARPFAREGLVLSVLEAAERFGAAVPLIPTVDTCKEIDAAGVIIRHLPRASVQAVQTPQGFSFREILAVHEKARAETPGREFTDDSEMWGFYRGPVHSVKGSESNRKITFPEDLR
jgi:2-C-methyl-D-erythritol 4-phosphate cytidylyltransferase